MKTRRVPNSLRQSLTKARQKLYREERKAKGLCASCGKLPAREGRTKCEPCGELAKLHKRKSPYKYIKYGIPIKRYERMLKAQKGLCAICGEPPGERSLAIDHNHDTRAVRGLLCGRCNLGLGMFKDSIDRLTKAIQYLGR